MIGSWIKLQYLRLMQDSLIFRPNHKKIIPARNPEHYGLHDTQDIYITTKDDVELHLWQHKAPENAPTFIWFHGNTGSWVDVGAPKKCEDYNRHYRLDLLEQTIAVGAGFIAVDLRGYGQSHRVNPSEESFKLDLEALIDYIETQAHIQPTELIIAGESLGAAIAYMLSQMLTKKQYPPKLLVAIAPFASMTHRVIQEHSKLKHGHIAQNLDHPFDSLERTKNLTPATRICFFHGTNDLTTHSYHSDMLIEQAHKHNLNTNYELMNGVGHIDWNAEFIIKRTLEFYKE